MRGDDNDQPGHDRLGRLQAPPAATRHRIPVRARPESEAVARHLANRRISRDGRDQSLSPYVTARPESQLPYRCCTPQRACPHQLCK
jgi:hypothetical protein